MRLLAPAIYAVLLLACGRGGDRLVSPTSRFVAVRNQVSPGVVSFVVEDGYGHVAYAPGDRFTEPVRVAWDANERLWISTTPVVVWSPHDLPHATGEGWAPLTPLELRGLVPPRELAR